MVAASLASRSALLARASAPASLRRVAAVAPASLAAAPQQVRLYSDKPAPANKASALIDLLPGDSVVAKTGWLTLGGGLLAAAISNEIYVLNGDSVIAAGFIILLTVAVKKGSGPFNDWANANAERITKLLTDARTRHADSIQERISAVEAQKDVVDITKGLYALAKETAQSEAKVFELQQKTALTSEVKAVLDSWVRYEAQVRDAEQKELATTVVKQVQDALKEPSLQQQILDKAIAEVESLVAAKKL